MKSYIFDKLAFLSLFLVIVLLPLFFLPFTKLPVETSKGLLLVVGLSICIIFWGFARFFDGKITFPKSICLLGGGGVVLAFLLSAFAVEASQVSLFGNMFDIGTFWFIFSGFLLMFISSVIGRNPKNAKILLFGAILSSAVVLLFQSVRLFLPDLLSFGVLAGKTGNLIGTWNSFGIFAGFSALMCLLVAEFFSTTKLEKFLLQVLVLFSLFMVASVNFPFVWAVLGIFSLIIFVYKASSRTDQSEEVTAHFPAFSFVVIIITLLFFISGGFIGNILPNRLNLQNNEISLSFNATLDITKSALKDNPILGVGPNKFNTAWAKYKPIDINKTNFWDVSFSSGSGLLPTFAATTGALGILFGTVFFVLFLINGVKSIFSSIKNSANWETTAFFVLSLYLFVSCFFYSAGATLFLLALAFAGVFLGLFASSRNKEISIFFLNDHRKSFFSILFLVVLVIASAAASFKYIERLMSGLHFGQALQAATLPEAEASIGKALKLYVNDLYLRTYAQIYLLKLNSLVAKGEDLSEQDGAMLQTVLDQAVSGAKMAVAHDPSSYLNFQTLGSIYQTAGLLGVKEAYTQSLEAYKMASSLNPKDPSIQLALASSSFSLNKKEDAKEYANLALSLKPDYVDALISLSRIAKSEGDNAAALNYAQTALTLSPDNPDLIQYIKSLRAPVSSSTTKHSQENG